MVELVMDLYFISDVLVCFNTGYYVRGNLILQRHYIIWNYLRTWFILDVLASFPWSYVFPEQEDQSSSSGASSTLS